MTEGKGSEGSGEHGAGSKQHGARSTEQVLGVRCQGEVEMSKSGKATGSLSQEPVPRVTSGSELSALRSLLSGRRGRGQAQHGGWSGERGAWSTERGAGSGEQGAGGGERMTRSSVVSCHS